MKLNLEDDSDGSDSDIQLQVDNAILELFKNKVKTTNDRIILQNYSNI